MPRAGRIKFDATGNRIFETGVDRGVVYPWDTTTSTYTNGEVWDGLTSVDESPEGAEPTDIYADNIKYATMRSAETFGATVECYTVPETIMTLDGNYTPVPGIYVGQQARPTFGMCYRTLVGNDVLGTEYGYKLKLLYGCSISPSERSYETVNDSPDAITLSYDLTTTPVNVTGAKPTSIITIDSTKVDSEKLKTFEDILYGKDADETAGTAATIPTLPMPDAVIAHFQ